MNRNKTFIRHLPGTMCFNVVHSDDVITPSVVQCTAFGWLVHYITSARRYCIILVHTLKHLLPDTCKCVINITYWIRSNDIMHMYMYCANAVICEFRGACRMLVSCPDPPTRKGLVKRVALPCPHAPYSAYQSGSSKVVT